MDAGFAGPTAPHPVAIVLGLCAAGAFVFALIQILGAFRAANADPAFRALGLRKWVMGVFVFAHMPDSALPYVKRYFVGFGLFMASILGIFIFVLLSAPGTEGAGS